MCVLCVCELGGGKDKGGGGEYMLMGSGERWGGLEVGREKWGRGVLCRLGGRTEAVCVRMCSCVLSYVWCDDACRQV